MALSAKKRYFILLSDSPVRPVDFSFPLVEERHWKLSQEKRKQIPSSPLLCYCWELARSGTLQIQVTALSLGMSGNHRDYCTSLQNTNRKISSDSGSSPLIWGRVCGTSLVAPPPPHPPQWKSMTLISGQGLFEVNHHLPKETVPGLVCFIFQRTLKWAEVVREKRKRWRLRQRHRKKLNTAPKSSRMATKQQFQLLCLTGWFLWKDAFWQKMQNQTREMETRN